MKLITLTRANDGSKVFVNPDAISMVSKSDDTTIVSLIGDSFAYVMVKENPDTVAELAQRKDDGTTQAPSEPERKKGKWIEEEKGIHVTSYRCSECGRTVMDDTGYDVSKDYPYCNCGADMRGEKDG